jgi:hypothetical protein
MVDESWQTWTCVVDRSYSVVATVSWLGRSRSGFGFKAALLRSFSSRGRSQLIVTACCSRPVSFPCRHYPNFNSLSYFYIVDFIWERKQEMQFLMLLLLKVCKINEQRGYKLLCLQVSSPDIGKRFRWNWNAGNTLKFNESWKWQCPWRCQIWMFLNLVCQ